MKETPEEREERKSIWMQRVTAHIDNPRSRR